MNEQRQVQDVQFFGVRRTVDDLGRIVIPAEFRTLLKLKPRSDIAYQNVYVTGFGQGIFVFKPPKKMVGGRRIDELGRFTAPVRMCREHGIHKQGIVELVPVRLDGLGYGLFIHSVSGDCVVGEELE